MNKIPTTMQTTPKANRIKAVVRVDDCLLDPVAELMIFLLDASRWPTRRQARPTRFVADGRTLLRPAYCQHPGRLQALNLANTRRSMTSRHEPALTGRTWVSRWPFSAGARAGSPSPRTRPGSQGWHGAPGPRCAWPPPRRRP